MRAGAAVLQAYGAADQAYRAGERRTRIDRGITAGSVGVTEELQAQDRRWRIPRSFFLDAHGRDCRRLHRVPEGWVVVFQSRRVACAYKVKLQSQLCPFRRKSLPLKTAACRGGAYAYETD